MKRIIRKIRIFFVTAFANREYNKAVKKADELARRHLTNYYVAIKFEGKGLYIINRKGFRHIKREINTDAIWQGLGPINHDTMLELKHGCFYHTKLYGREKELRRLAYIEYVLDLAGIKKEA